MSDENAKEILMKILSEIYKDVKNYAPAKELLINDMADRMIITFNSESIDYAGKIFDKAMNDGLIEIDIPSRQTVKVSKKGIELLKSES